VRAESLSAPAKWDFQVKLSREGSTLYWLNGREAIVGDIDKSGRFAFETHLDVPLADTHGAAKGCTIVRSDSASGALDNAESSFKGALTYAYAATMTPTAAPSPRRRRPPPRPAVQPHVRAERRPTLKRIRFGGVTVWFQLCRRNPPAFQKKNARRV